MMKTCRELAEKMLISRSTVYRAMEDGRIASVPAGRLKRISDEEFARVMREGIPEADSMMRDIRHGYVMARGRMPPVAKEAALSDCAALTSQLALPALGRSRFAAMARVAGVQR